jgi:hypothetical protein
LVQSFFDHHSSIPENKQKTPKQNTHTQTSKHEETEQQSKQYWFISCIHRYRDIFDASPASPPHASSLNPELIINQQG